MPVRVAVAQVQVPGSGDVTFDFDGFGIPAGALFFATPTTTIGNTTTASAAMAVGATDGTRQWTVGMVADDAVKKSAEGVRGATNTCLLVPGDSTGGIALELAFDSFGVDEVVCSVTTRLTNCWVTCVAFTGRDCEFYAGTIDNTAGNVNVTDPGFEPSLVILASNHGALDDTARTYSGSGNAAALSLGFGTWDGTTLNQMSSNFNYSYVAGASNAAFYNSVTEAIRYIRSDGAAMYGGVSLASFDSDGFTANRISSSGTYSGYLACRFVDPGGDHDTILDLVAESTETGTGEKDHTKTGHRIQAWLNTMTMATANASLRGGAEAGVIGVSAGADNTEDRKFVEACHSATTKDAVTTCVAKNMVCRDLYRHRPHDATDAGPVARTKTSETGNVSTEWDRVDGTQRYWMSLTFEEYQKHEIIAQGMVESKYYANDNTLLRFAFDATYDGTDYRVWSDTFTMSYSAPNYTLTHDDSSTAVETGTASTLDLGPVLVYVTAKGDRLFLVHEETGQKIGELTI